jgi:hypothetical protein
MCSTAHVQPVRVVHLQRYGVATLVAVVAGMLVMFLFGLFGTVKLGAALWLALVLVPIGLYLATRHRRQHQAVYQRGLICTLCGHRWLPGLHEPPVTSVEIQSRLRAIEQHRQAPRSSGAER